LILGTSKHAVAEKYAFAVVVGVAILILGGCAYGAGGAEPRMVKAEESFVLSPGEKVQIERTVIRFVGVEGDSRCPKGVHCIWEGSATLRFAVEGTDQTFTLETSRGTPVVVGGTYHLVVESLDPYPGDQKKGDSSTYRATLRFVPLPVS